MKASAAPKCGNWILQHGLLIAPIAVFAASLRSALALCTAFTAITVPTALLSALIPMRLPASLRIVLYSVIGGLVYIPAALLTNTLFPTESGGIYLPLLCSAMYLTVQHDRFLPRKRLLRQLVLQSIGACAVMLLFGALRELLGSGSLMYHPLWNNPPLPMLLTPAGGLILLALCMTAAQYAANARQEGEAHAVCD